MGDDSLNIWVGLGQLVVAIIALVWEVFFKSKQPTNVDTRVAGIVIGGSLTLAVPGFVIYWVSIILGTLAPGTAAVIFARSTTLAALLGMTWGMVWTRFLLPLLVKRAKRETGGSEDGESE